MAEGSGTQAPGKEPPLSIQVLRAQYEGLRRQQRARAYLVVLPTGRAGQVLGQKPKAEGGGPGYGHNGWWAAARASGGSVGPPGGKEQASQQSPAGGQFWAALLGSVPLQGPQPGISQPPAVPGLHS